MKNLLLAICLTATINAHTVEEWCTKLVDQATEHDCQEILDLCLRAWARAETTRRVQIACADFSYFFDERAHEMVRTRRNPHRATSISAPEDFMTAAQQFVDATERHRSANKAYDDLLEKLVNGAELSAIAKHQLLELRAAAREELLKILSEEALNEALEQLLKHRSFLTQAYELLSQGAYQGFIEADRVLERSDEQLRSALRELHKAGNVLWQTIEECRSNFFLAHYKSLSQAMHSRGYRVPFPPNLP